MIKLNRFQLAAVKRTAQNVKMRRKQADKLRKIKEENDRLLESLDREIMMWENPIIEMTGYTSTEVLSLIDDNLEIPEKNGESVATEEVPQINEGTPEVAVETTPIEGNDNFINY